jgi:plastocyanin
MPRRRLAALAAAAAAAAVLLAAPPAQAGGGCHQDVTEGSGTEVLMREQCYMPSILRVAPGTTVTFANQDAMAHPTNGRTSNTAEGAFYLSGGLRSQETVSYQRPGVYPFACMVHPGMTGLVIVGGGQGEVSPAAAQPAAARPAAASTAPESPGQGGDETRTGLLGLAGGTILGIVVTLLATTLRRRRTATPTG